MQKIFENRSIDQFFGENYYGGGAGRNSATAGTLPRSGAIVELYNKATGAFIAATTTNASGIYTFSNQTAGDIKYHQFHL